MPDTNLTENVTINAKGRITVEGDLYKDAVDIVVTAAHNEEERIACGGILEVIPAGKIYRFEFSPRLSTDVVDTNVASTDNKKMTSWINDLNNNIFPKVAFVETAEDRDADTVVLTFTGSITGFEYQRQASPGIGATPITFTGRVTTGPTLVMVPAP